MLFYFKLSFENIILVQATIRKFFRLHIYFRCLMVSEEKIVDGCIAGKRKAFNLLYKKYAPVMLGVCMRYCKSAPEAEDVLQEGFIKVFKNMRKFRKEGSFEGWIKRIMINTAIDNYQSSLKHYFHAHIEDLDETIILGTQADHEWEPPQDKISRNKIMALVQQLPDGYRMVFNLYAIEGMGHKEIAGLLHITESTSKTQLFKARRSLKNLLKQLSERQEKQYSYNDQ